MIYFPEKYWLRLCLHDGCDTGGVVCWGDGSCLMALGELI